MALCLVLGDSKGNAISTKSFYSCIKCIWLECMHIQLMEIILENLWKFLFVAVSCLFCECPQKRFKKEEKAHLKQPTMDTHLLYFFRRSLDPLYLFLLPLQLESNRIGCRLGHSFYTCLSCYYQGFSLFFELLVTLHIETKLLQYKTTLVAEKCYFFTVFLFL